MQSELILEPDNREVATVPQSDLRHDLRHLMMTLPVEQQQVMLGHYWERRQAFRDWLHSKLVEGVHFGFPPGCEPKSKVAPNGVTLYGNWNKKKNDYDWFPETQWKPKPPLYGAGADLVCDIMGVRDEYETDLAGWQQMGGKAGTAVVKCKLVSRATGEVIGESLGAYHNAYDANNALKMAGKCAKVGAVINAYDLRDLFTQEEPPPNPPNANPEANTDAPTAQPRGKRNTTAVSEQQFKQVKDIWLSKHPNPLGDMAKAREAFKQWVLDTTRRKFNPGILADWRVSDYEACCRELNIEAEGLE